MNSKMIAIIAVVAMCGAALVGVGYAYQATYTESGNTVSSDSQYVTLDDNGTILLKLRGVIDYNYDGTTGKYTATNTNPIATQNVKFDIGYGGVPDAATKLYLKVKSTDLSLDEKLTITVQAYKNSVSVDNSNKLGNSFTLGTTDSSIEIDKDSTWDINSVVLVFSLTHTNLNGAAVDYPIDDIASADFSMSYTLTPTA